MNCGLTWNEVWTLLGFVGFSGLILGMAVSNMLNAGRDADIYLEEE